MIVDDSILRRSTLTHGARSQYNFSVFRDAKRVSAASRTLGRPVRTVLKWQVIATAALTLLAWLWGGAEAALSAALGGAVSVCAGGMSALVAAAGKKSAGGVLIAALLAEGVKIGLIVVLLWTVLVMVDDLVMPAFFGSFFATILLFSMAFFVREYK